jgi:phosphomannomutase
MALVAGMMSAGTVVLDGGCLPQPVLSLLARENGTGALCTVFPESVRFQAEDHGWLTDFRGGVGHCALPPEAGNISLRPMNCYFRKLAQLVDVEAIKEFAFAVRLSAQGASAEFASKLLAKFNCRIVKDGADCDAAFSLSSNARSLRVGEYGPEMTVRMVFEHILEAYPGNTVLSGGDRMAEEIIQSCGCEYFSCGGEESEILDAMRQQGAALGGSVSNGMVVWRKFQPAADGLMAMILVLEMMALSGQSMTVIAESLR